jgi:hypothetical protein
MVIFTFRTKIEIAIGFSLILVLATLTAIAVTRTISDTGDTVETFIKNSNGKYWSISEANLQAAINDLGNTSWYGGVVTFPGHTTLTLTTGIVLREGVTLDLQGSMLKTSSNINVVTMASGASLKDGTIDTSTASTYTKSAILFDPIATGQHYAMDGLTQVENMYLHGGSNKGSAITYQVTSYVSGDNTIAWTQCNHIQVFNFKYGILLNCTGGTDASHIAYINENLFDDFIMWYCQNFIYLNRNEAVTHGYCDTDGNTFNNFVIETESNCNRIIYAEGQYNLFTNIYVMDWGETSATYAFEFPSDARMNYLSYYIDDNNGLQSNNHYISNQTNPTYLNTRVDLHHNIPSLMTFSQNSEPDIPTNSMAFWYNTSNGKYYIIQDFNGTQKKAELT